MGLRFRKSVKILPGVRLNFSKSGMSTSIGGPGATVNFGPKGTRHTVGLPGSGLSYSTFTPKGGDRAPAPSASDPADKLTGCGVAFVLIILIAAVARCAGGMSGGTATPVATASAEAFYAEPSGAAAQFADGDRVAVTSTSLFTRSEPSTGAVVTGSFRKGETATIVRRSGEWLQVAQGAAMVWIAANHVKATRPNTQGFSSGHSTRQSKHRRNRAGASSAPATYFDAGCPCSGSRVCIGPRGGRYCITRSGRKRYGV